MADHLDLSKGWCCNGKTWTEHAAEEDGDCCQPEGTQLEDLPTEAQQEARKRLSSAES